MPHIQLGYLVNPNRAHVKCERSFPRETDLYDLTEDAIPDDAQFIGATDDTGLCVGTTSAARVRKILQVIKQIPLEPLLDELDEAVVAVNLEGTIFYVNLAYTKILGVPAGKILGKDLHIIESGASLLDVLHSGAPIVRDKQFIQTVQRYVSVRMFPLTLNGKLVGAASIFRDTTEVNRLNLELKRTAQMAEEYDRQLKAQAILKQGNIIGESHSFVSCVMKASAIAGSDATVLLRGESGVGKEVFARLIFQNSPRKDKPFIAMNCAAIPESLIESELFGYEDGAFTGARRGGQMGKFQLAEGGTLFLDEIGDMPLPMQAKLLRVLQEGEIEKLGRQRPIKVDVRLIAATNQPLEQMIAEGRFRQDLFYRLNVVPIEIPPLREREHDVALLAVHYLDKYNQKYRKQVRLSEDVFQLFLQYHWPGNVRELQNVIERCVVLCERGTVMPADLPAGIFQSVRENPTVPTFASMPAQLPERLDEAVAACQRAVILSALSKCGKNRQRAAELLGIPLRTFYRKIKELQIQLP